MDKVRRGEGREDRRQEGTGMKWAEVVVLSEGGEGRRGWVWRERKAETDKSIAREREITNER